MGHVIEMSQDYSKFALYYKACSSSFNILVILASSLLASLEEWQSFW